jgi:hypothetical protein
MALSDEIIDSLFVPEEGGCNFAEVSEFLTISALFRTQKTTVDTVFNFCVTCFSSET